jgi:hypothetical protein
VALVSYVFEEFRFAGEGLSTQIVLMVALGKLHFKCWILFETRDTATFIILKSQKNIHEFMSLEYSKCNFKEEHIR